MPVQPERRAVPDGSRRAHCHPCVVTLLREIQDAAVGTDVPVSVLLRRCLVLAARLEHEPLRDWARQELEGYSDDADLPPYRPKVGTTVRGNFSGAFGSSLSNAALAKSVVPEEWRDHLFTTEVRDRVAQPTGSFPLRLPGEQVGACRGPGFVDRTARPGVAHRSSAMPVRGSRRRP